MLRVIYVAHYIGCVDLYYVGVLESTVGDWGVSNGATGRALVIGGPLTKTSAMGGLGHPGLR